MLYSIRKVSAFLKVFNVCMIFLILYMWCCNMLWLYDIFLQLYNYVELLYVVCYYNSSGSCFTTPLV